MSDMSHMDKKYFIDKHVYNCPFCKRNNVNYYVNGLYSFDWNKDKKCHCYLVLCSSCRKESLHLSYEYIGIYECTDYQTGTRRYRFNLKEDKIDIDSVFFYSVPTSHFALDARIPAIIRELITEAEGSLKMNFLTGASACMRKAIYELTIIEKAEGDDYETKIKFLKGEYPKIDTSYFDILASIKDMTSDKIHEQSWDKWDSKGLRLILEILRAILHEMYVLPEIKKERKKGVDALLKDLKDDKKELQKIFKNEPKAKIK